MPQYLAKYTVNAYMFDGGAWMPDFEPHKKEHKFIAKDENEARVFATNYMYSKGFREQFFAPSTTLDALLEVKDVEIKDNKV